MRRRTLIAAAATAAAAGTGLLIMLRRETTPPPPKGPPTDAPFAPNAYLRLDTDGRLLLRTGQTELGQGVHTALALIVAHELDVDVARITVETAADDAAYANPLMGRQRTAWSASVRAWWDPLRRAAAQARAMLVAEAAERWGVDPADCRTVDGTVQHPDGRRTLAYGALAAAAGRREPPTRVTPRPAADLAPARAVRRLDAAAKVTGRAVYAADVQLPDRLVAAVQRPPRLDLAPLAVDDTAARALPGVVAVVPFSGGVAVLARDTWTARRAAAALRIRWPDVAAATPPAALPEAPPLPTDCPITLTAGTAPLLHAALEPQACTARWQADGCEIWTGTQDQTTARERAAAIAGLPPDRIRLTTTYAGGAFGRGTDVRVVEEAVRLARAAPGRPVTLQWTREEDFALDVVRSPSRHALGAALNARGELARWHHHVRTGPGGDAAAALPYRVRERRITAETVTLPLREGLWRAVEAGPACFAIELLIEAAAAAAGAEPLAFRLAHVDDARARAVLDALATASGWAAPAAPGTARGCALHSQTGSWCAVAAEAVLRDGAPRVTRLTAVVDAGLVVHPDGARQQVEGALLMGLGSALTEWTGLHADGGPSVRQFGAYPLLRLPEAPVLDVRFVASGSVPHGLGEVALPPVAPAVATAFSTLLGRPLRDLPLRPAP